MENNKLYSVWALGFDESYSANNFERLICEFETAEPAISKLEEIEQNNDIIKDVLLSAAVAGCRSVEIRAEALSLDDEEEETELLGSCYIELFK